MYTMRPDPSPHAPEQNKVKQSRRVNFQLWLSGADADRYAELRAQAKRRQPYSKDSDLNRRLVGLDRGQELLTDKEVLYFRAAGERPDTISVEKLPNLKKAAAKRKPKANDDKADDDAA